MNPELRHLLSGYATGTLTAAERERLFAAALDDQELFDALAEEQSLKDLLDDPESRGYLLAELDRLAGDSSGIDLPAATRTMSVKRAVPIPMAIPMAPMGTAVPVQAPLPPPPPPRRFWLPLSAVMLALVLTGWVWWRNQPVPVEVAISQPVRPPVPAAPIPNEVGPAKPAAKAPEPERPAARPVEVAEKRASVQAISQRQESGALEPAAAPPVDNVTKDNVSKKEADAPARKAVAEVADSVSAAPAPVPAVAGSVARAAYQLLRLENGQFVPTPADARFQAGETLALRVPFVSDPPQVTFANRQPLALEREGAWYRTETVTLSSGQHDFVVAPPSTLTRSRLAAQAPPEAKAKAMANTAPTVLRIRIQVTP